MATKFCQAELVSSAIDRGGLDGHGAMSATSRALDGLSQLPVKVGTPNSRNERPHGRPRRAWSAAQDTSL